MWILAGILIAAAIAGLAYLAYRLTVAALKKYRQRKQTQIVMADLGDMIKQMPDKDKHTYSFDELESLEDEQIIAEYDEENDEVVQAQIIGSEGMEQKIENAMYANDGFLIIED